MRKKILMAIALLALTGFCVFAKNPDSSMGIRKGGVDSLSVLKEVENYKYEKTDDAIRLIERNWETVSFKKPCDCDSYVNSLAWLYVINKDYKKAEATLFEKQPFCLSIGRTKVSQDKKVSKFSVYLKMANMIDDRQFFFQYSDRFIENIPYAISYYEKALENCTNATTRNKTEKQIVWLKAHLENINRKETISENTELVMLTKSVSGPEDKYEEQLKPHAREILETLKQAIITKDLDLFKSVFLNEPKTSEMNTYEKLSITSLEIEEPRSITAEKRIYKGKAIELLGRDSDIYATFGSSFVAIHSNGPDTKGYIYIHMTNETGSWKIIEIDDFNNMLVKN